MKTTTTTANTDGNLQTTLPAADQSLISHLQYLPVSLFGSTVALAGGTIGWRQAVILFGASPLVSNSAGIFAWTVFILLSAGYLYKFINYKSAVIAELTSPVAANFLGTFFISAVLLSTVAAPFLLPLARNLVCRYSWWGCIHVPVNEKAL